MLMVVIIFLESKIVGFCSLSVSVSSKCVVVICHSMMDLLKFMGKKETMISLLLLKVLGLVLFLFLLFSISSVMVVANIYSSSTSFSFILYLYIGFFILYMKLYFISLLCKFSTLHQMVGVKVVSSLVLIECLAFVFSFLAFFTMDCGEKGVEYGSSTLLNSCGLMVIVFFLLLIVLVKGFSIPFDFLELESELVGGTSVEIGGVVFSIWAMMEYGSGVLYVKFLMSWMEFCGVLSKISKLVLTLLVVMVFVFMIRSVFSSGAFSDYVFMVLCLFLMVQLIFVMSSVVLVPISYGVWNDLSYLS